MIVKYLGIKHYVHSIDVTEGIITKMNLMECGKKQTPLIKLTGKSLSNVLNTMSDEDIKELIDGQI